MSGHLGTEIPALVDGELDHAARERALAHLAGCAACRAEVEDERRLKARLRGVGAAGPRPGEDLAQRLLRLARTEVPLPGPAAAPGPPPAPPHPGRLSAASLLTPPPLPSAPARSGLPRGVLGGTAVVLGTVAVLALGGPARTPSRPPLDPASDAFVADFAGTGTTPLTGPVRTASIGGR